MRVQLLPSSFEENGGASTKQHLTCILVDDRIAFDAGSLAMASSMLQKRKVRDVVLSHAHLDHIAGLPLFVDDLFSTLTEPIRIHATAEVIEILERDIFNWSVYPRFSELFNQNGPVMMYLPFKPGVEFRVGHLSTRAIPVNHKVPSCGFIVSDGFKTFAMSGDTAAMDDFWHAVNEASDLSAVLVECAFPNELQELAAASHHLTPSGLMNELAKCERSDCTFYVVNLKPAYREQTIEQIDALNIENLKLLEVGRVYEW
ncbi:MAG: 3',5'-cyclic-nucleotide phosphodiesterase [Blastocatellia bacterium]|nr:3',5'-cyclic-nucleotide phosphodiesterase [Blastocatellia bacterium]